MVALFPTVVVLFTAPATSVTAAAAVAVPLVELAVEVAEAVREEGVIAPEAAAFGVPDPAAPTTVLARQHFEVFRKRFKDEDVQIGHLSRAADAAEAIAGKQSVAA